MAKRDPILLRQFLSIALVAIAILFSVSLHRWVYPATPTKIVVRDSLKSTLVPRQNLQRRLNSTDKTPVVLLTEKPNLNHQGRREELSPIFPSQDIKTSPILKSTPPEQIDVISNSQEISPPPNLDDNQPSQTTNALPLDPITQEISIQEEPISTYFIPPQFQGKIVYRIEGSNEDKVIALTFDDGPRSETTPQVLDILKQNNILATFFWIGENLKAYPQIAQQVVADGHAIGNHTWHHWYDRMDYPTIINEINKTTKLIYEITGIQTSLFRPPGGVLDNGLVDYAKQKNYTIVMWSDDSKDYHPRPANELVKTVIDKAQSGLIVLMHDGGGNRAETIKALPEIIKQLQQLGYRFVTIPELLDMGM